VFFTTGKGKKFLEGGLVMSIKAFELFHGVVLTKLIRNDNPISLSLFGRQEGEPWAVYRVNEAVYFFVKSSMKARELLRPKGGVSWQFIFNNDQLRQIRELKIKLPVCVVLVGGMKDISHCKNMQVCFLEPADVDELLELENDINQSLTVKYEPGKWLKIVRNRKEVRKIARTALDNWEVPGR
jgi:hypothetical protein